MAKSQESKKDPETEPKTKKYFVGTIDGAPFQDFTIGGFCFPNFTNELIKDDTTAQMVPSKKKGDILELYDDEVKRIKETAVKKAIRWNSNKTRGFIINKDEKYKANINDEPISKYIYLIPIDEIGHNNPLWREKDPEPLSHTPKEKEPVENK